MDAASVATVSAVVVMLTQVVKHGFPIRWRKRMSVYISMSLSLAGVALWIVSEPYFPPPRTAAFEIFAGWVAVFAASTGIYQSVKRIRNGPQD